MLDSLPFPTSRFGSSVSSGVIAWIGQKARDGSRPPLSANCQLLLVNNCNDVRLFVLLHHSTYLHKLGSVLPALCFVGVSFAGCDRQAAVALMTLGTMFIAGMYCGFLSNHIDIASNYAGTLMALTNTAATIPGFIVPVFVGQMTHGNVSYINICYDIYVPMTDCSFFIIAKSRPVADYLFHNICNFDDRIFRIYFSGFG